MKKSKELKIKPKKTESEGFDSDFDRIMDEILGESEAEDIGMLLDNKDRGYILRKILESADKMIDSLENAWEVRPASMNAEDQSKILEAIERARQLRTKIADDLLPKSGIFIKDVAGEA